MKLHSFLSLSFLFLSVAPMFGWGQKGHDTVAFIAENHLTPVTRQKISELLDGKSIVYWANWMDNASHTPEYAYTKTWHYKNIDPEFSYDTAPNIPEGNVVQAIYEQTELLNKPDTSKEQKALALKMIVHFMGDLHQPMHMGRASDLGGNRHSVKLFDRYSNLHSAWDSWLPEQAHKWSYTEWAQQIDRNDTTVNEEIFTITNPDEWGRQTYEIATKIYDTTPEDSALSYDYIAEWTPVVEQQFLRGGLRLADILNSIFDTEYLPLNSFVQSDKQ